MKTEIQPQESIRAEAFKMWMSSPQPMVTLPVSLQFHHVQMDGGHAACFLEGVQQAIHQLKG